MSSTTVDPTVTAPDRGPVQDPSRREQVSLTPNQVAFLRSETRPAALVKRAVIAALLTPLVLVAVCAKLTKQVTRIPMFGWLLVFYGLVAMIIAGMIGVMLIPFVFAVALPVALFRGPAKINQDLESAQAISQSGRFAVTDNGGAGGKLAVGDAPVSIDKKQLEAIRQALTGTGDTLALNGTVVYTPHQRQLMRVCDGDGRELLSVA